jgi:hypothetical protein
MSNNNEQVDNEYEALKNSKFKQQKLPAWRPVPTITSTSLTFLFFGIVFIIIGIFVIIYSNDIVEISQGYDVKCQLSNNCQVEFNIPKDMKAPVMVYYQLNNFYQNHRRYVKSKSNAQLKGELFTADSLKSANDCDPIYTMKDLNKTLSVGGTPLAAEAPANPCGLIAKSLFTDRYALTDANNKPITIDESNIAWDADRKLKYAHPVDPEGKDKDYWKKVQWTDVMDEHFMVWMRPAGLPNFRKLWGRVNTNLTAGNYKMLVNSTYDVSQFKGEKLFVLSTVNSFGGKNSFLGISYIVVGTICIVMAIAFVIGYKIHNSQNRKEN